MSALQPHHRFKARDWRYIGSYQVTTLPGYWYDRFATNNGCLVIVSKDAPAPGWHVSIGPLDVPVPGEIIEREARAAFNQLGVDYKFLWKSPKTEAYHYQQTLTGGTNDT